MAFFPTLWNCEFSLFCSLLSLIAIQRGWNDKVIRVRFISSCHRCDYITRKEHLVLSEQPICRASQEAYCYHPAWSVGKLMLLGLHGEHASDLPEHRELTEDDSGFLERESKMPPRCWKHWQGRPPPPGDHPVNLRLQEATDLWFNYKCLPAWPQGNTWTDFESQSL